MTKTIYKTNRAHNCLYKSVFYLHGIKPFVKVQIQGTTDFIVCIYSDYSPI